MWTKIEILKLLHIIVWTMDYLSSDLSIYLKEIQSLEKAKRVKGKWV